MEDIISRASAMSTSLNMGLDGPVFPLLATNDNLFKVEHTIQSFTSKPVFIWFGEYPLKCISNTLMRRSSYELNFPPYLLNALLATWLFMNDSPLNDRTLFTPFSVTFNFSAIFKGILQHFTYSSNTSNTNSSYEENLLYSSELLLS